MRPTAAIESVGQETRDVLDELYAGRGQDPGRDDPSAAHAPESGVIFRVNYDELIEVAARAGCVLELVPMIGDFVPANAPLFQIDRDADALDVGEALKAVALGPERTLNQDVAYGFRMLIDIAERSLSDAFDPTTAVQAIDRLHDCLRQLARRPFPSGEYRDRQRTVRLRVAHVTWEGYVRLAIEEIRQVGASSAHVTRRLKAALEDLLTVAPPDRRPPLEWQLALLDGAIAENDWPAAERAEVASDMQGIGSSRSLRGIARPA